MVGSAFAGSGFGEQVEATVGPGLEPTPAAAGQVVAQRPTADADPPDRPGRDAQHHHVVGHVVGLITAPAPAMA